MKRIIITFKCILNEDGTCDIFTFDGREQMGDDCTILKGGIYEFAALWDKIIAHYGEDSEKHIEFHRRCN